MRNRRGIAILAIVILATAGNACAQGSGSSREEAGSQPAAAMEMKMPGEPATIEGTLVDLKCYAMMPEKNIGDDHTTADGTVMEGCATACAKMGIPVGIVPDGKAGDPAVVLAVSATQLAKHMAKTARVKGRRIGDTLIVDSIEVREGDRWEQVKLKTMM